MLDVCMKLADSARFSTVYLEARVKAKRGNGQAGAGGRPICVTALALPILPSAAVAPIVLRGRRLLLRSCALSGCLWLLSALLLMLACSMRMKPCNDGQLRTDSMCELDALEHLPRWNCSMQVFQVVFHTGSAMMQ